MQPLSLSIYYVTMLEDIREYVDVEYAAHRFDLLRQSIYDLRQTKRLFPVNLYGPEGISRKEDFLIDCKVP